MKRVMVILMTIAGLCIASNLSAQTDTGKTSGNNETNQIVQKQATQQATPYYTDKNGDGICDNRTGRSFRGGNFVDANNDGVCDNRANRGGRGNGQNFVDANNDGVCDNVAEGKQGRGNGRGNGRCGGSGQGIRHRNGQR